MSNILALTKVLIKNNVFAFSGKSKEGKSKSTKSSLIGFLILISFCIFSVGGPIVFALNNILKEYNLTELLLTYALPLGGIISIIFGVFSIVSVFYFNKDVEQLLHLPIKSSELLISKFLASLISEYLMLAMFIYPIIIGAGIGSGASFVYYIYAIIVFVLMPVIPSVIMSIIIMLANKLFNFGKRKDIFMYVVTGFILLFSFGYSFGLNFLITPDSSENIMVLLSGDYGQYLKLGRCIFPFINSATYSLVHYKEFLGFSSIMTFIGLNIFFFLILYYVGDKLYIRGLINNVGNNKKKKYNSKDIYAIKSGSVLKELVKKEWLIIKRSPIFMLNVIISNVIFPVVLGVSLLFGGVLENRNAIGDLTKVIDFSNSGVLLISIGVLLFMCSMCTSTSSSISRDGSSAVIMKTMPISFKKQMDAKVIFSMIVDMFVLFLTELLLFIFIRIRFDYLLLINIPLILILLIINYTSLLLDLRKPRLDWNEESEAVKQNFNVFLSLMLVIVVSAVLILIGVLLLKYNLNIYLIFTAVSVILLATYILMMILISKNQDKLFSKVG